MKHARMSVGLALAMLALGMGLAGCTDPIVDAEARLRPLIGQKENVLIAVMGAPAHSITKNGVTYLAFLRQHPVVIPGVPVVPPYYGPDGELSWNISSSYFPEQVVVRRCEAIFAVSGGVVVSFTVGGDGC